MPEITQQRREHVALAILNAGMGTTIKHWSTVESFIRAHYLIMADAAILAINEKLK